MGCNADYAVGANRSVDADTCNYQLEGINLSLLGCRFDWLLKGAMCLNSLSCAFGLSSMHNGGKSKDELRERDRDVSTGSSPLLKYMLE